KAAAAAARGAAEKTAKRNPIPTLKAALKPVFKGTDLVSSSPLTPARVVQSFKANVQDSGRVFDFFKKQVVGDGNVIQNVAETVTAVSEIAQSGATPEDALGVLGGFAGRNKGRGKHHDESSGGADPGCVRKNSFDPSTLVVMGDGSRKPIKDVKVGDKVLAKDPTTGRSAVRVVTDVRSHASQRTLVEVGVASGADRGSVVATDEHPFWVASEKRWSNAVDLKAGHRLETGDHRDATVTGTRSWSETRQVYNLTVDTDHTYYVVAGQTPVLTHNESCTVGRWMSEGEHQRMVDTGMVQAGSSGTSTYVANPADPDAYRKEAAPGSIYVEFDVPCSCLKKAGKPGWAQIPGPEHPIYSKLNEKRGLPKPEMPRFENLRIVDRK
uniref:TreTu family toxin n=1 Tax=Amycolatopsis pittospori TaxID=2749434 RepID=UPI001A9DE4E7